MEKQLVKDLPNKDRVIANVTTDRGYVSLTGAVYEARKNMSGATRQKQGRDTDAGGQITDILIRAFPQLTPIARMHLSNTLTGEPMHAEANGWYFYSDAYQSTYEEACRTLRVNSIPEGLTREQFSRFVDDQRQRWAAEARDTLRLIESL